MVSKIWYQILSNAYIIELHLETTSKKVPSKLTFMPLRLNFLVGLFLEPRRRREISLRRKSSYFFILCVKRWDLIIHPQQHTASAATFLTFPPSARRACEANSRNQTTRALTDYQHTFWYRAREAFIFKRAADAAEMPPCDERKRLRSTLLIHAHRPTIK